MVNFKLCVNERYTVKPDLTPTCEQRPVRVFDGQSKSQFYQAPLSIGRFFQVPGVAVVHRFDCTLKNSQYGMILIELSRKNR